MSCLGATRQLGAWCSRQAKPSYAWPSWGDVILIGRGANIITSGLPHVFHVRLVGSLEKRVGHIQETRGVEQREALEFVRGEDRGRQRYLMKYFGKDPDDVLLYHYGY